MSGSPIVARKADIESDSEVEAFGKTKEELDFWIECIGVPLLVVEKQTLTVRSANRSASTFFAKTPEAFSRCAIGELVGGEAEGMLGQIWSNAPIGIPGEPFLIRASIHQQERLLMVKVSKMVVEGESLRLFTFTDAPPTGSVAMAGWQENIIAMLNWLPFGFEIASTDDQIQFANSQFNELFGYSQDEIESIEDWWRLAYPDPDYRAFAKSQWHNSIAAARAENREMTPFDLDVTVKSGERRTIQFRHRTIGSFNVNLYLDVTRERAYARELKSLADTDPLTGAMNRRRFFEEAERVRANASSSSQIAMLMLDIDNFKSINDRFGHGCGDLVLTEFARRTTSGIDAADLLVRLGGEEFAVLLNRVDLEGAERIAERLRTKIAGRPFACNDIELDVTVSIGVAFCRPGESSIEQALARADKALYAAKNAGRNKVMVDG